MYGVGGSSDAISRDMNSQLCSSTFKHPSDGEFAKIKKLISSDPYSSYDHHNQYGRNQNQIQQQPGGRVQNEGLFFTNLLNEHGCHDFLDPDASSSPDSRDVLQYSLSSTAIKQETKEPVIQKQDLPRPSTSFGVMNSTSSNLFRQSSSPAWFLPSSTVGNGFVGTRDLGKGVSSKRLNNRIRFPSSPSSFLPKIAEDGKEMNDAMFNRLKRSRECELKMCSNKNGLDAENGDYSHHTRSLVHHTSLPKTSSQMAAIENFLQFQQDFVPCKIRAKRGFATHPRSIAERERRTRISERIKKLQELFPNMDKQINTADMLDMAMECIKDLQKEVQQESPGLANSDVSFFHFDNITLPLKARLLRSSTSRNS